QEAIAVNVRKSLVVFHDQYFLSHEAVWRTLLLIKYFSRKARMAWNSSPILQDNSGALISFPASPWRSRSRSRGTIRLMPHVALAAQRSTIVRTSSGRTGLAM